MSKWIPFHSSLREGDKRGISRASRFVYLEISLLARSTNGELVLPRGFRSDADALHDLLGGDRREVRRALTELTATLDPDDSDSALILLRGSPDRRVILIRNYSKWVKSDQSRDRVAKFREARVEDNQLLKPPATVTVTPLDKIRVEERENINNTPIPPSQGVLVDLIKTKPEALADPPAADPPAADPESPPKSAPEPAAKPDPVQQIFAKFSRVRAKHRPKSIGVGLKLEERKRAEKLLKAGYSVAALKLACEGIFHSSWHLGKNDRNTEYLAFFNVLSPTQVDALIELGRKVRDGESAEEIEAPFYDGTPDDGPPATPEQREMFAQQMAELKTIIAANTRQF